MGVVWVFVSDSCGIVGDGGKCREMKGFYGVEFERSFIEMRLLDSYIFYMDEVKMEGYFQY